MSKTIDNRGLKVELSRIPDKARVFCRPLFSEGECYGFQLVFEWDEGRARIFISKEVNNEESIKGSI